MAVPLWYRRTGFTLSKKKFTFCLPEVKCAGYSIRSSGIIADPDQIFAILKSLMLQNITELCSFLGLANQLGMFQQRYWNYNTATSSTPQEVKCFCVVGQPLVGFENIKAALTNPPILQPFDPQLPTVVLQMDASWTWGLYSRSFPLLPTTVLSSHNVAAESCLI